MDINTKKDMKLICYLDKIWLTVKSLSICYIKPSMA